MIERVELRNFKSFKKATVRFGNVSLILGANGAGKSNLFDAMRFLKSIGDGRSVRDAISGHASPSAATAIVTGVRGGAEAVPHFGSNSQEFELRASVKVQGERIDYYVRVNVQLYRVVQEELKSSKHPGPYVFSTQPETGPLEQNPESPALTARFYKETRGLNPRREFSPYDFLLSQFVSRRAESRLNERVAELAREEFASIRPLELQPEVLRQYSPDGKSELGEHGENFAAVVSQLTREAQTFQMLSGLRRERGEGGEDGQRNIAAERLQAVTAWLSELTPKRIADIEAIRAPTGEVVFALREEPHDRLIAAPSLSDGTLRFAAVALAAVGTRGRQTLLIEEIENGINPSRLALLIRMLEQTAEAESTVQVIASSHSPSVLDYSSRRTIQASTVIGWDSGQACSRPVEVASLPGIEAILKEATLGELQAEGWLQQAADV